MRVCVCVVCVDCAIGTPCTLLQMSSKEKEEKRQGNQPPNDKINQKPLRPRTLFLARLMIWMEKACSSSVPPTIASSSGIMPLN